MVILRRVYVSQGFAAVAGGRGSGDRGKRGGKQGGERQNRGNVRIHAEVV